MSDPRDRVPLKFVFVLAVLAILSWLLPRLTGCGDEQDQGAPFAPATSVVSEIYPEDPVVVRAWIENEWTQWVTVQDSLAIRVPMGETVAFQFKHLDKTSSLQGFSHPDLNTCFVMPAHRPGNSSWRVTYFSEPAGWPVAGRTECRPQETHMTESASKRLYASAELWDDDAGAYAFATQWIAIVWTLDRGDIYPHFDEGDTGDDRR